MAHCKCRLLILFAAHILPLSGLREAEQFSWGHRPVPTEEVGLTVPTQHTDSGLCTLKAHMRTQAFQPSTHTYKHKCMYTQRPVGTL